MKQSQSQWRWLFKYLTYLLAATFLFACLLSAILAHADSNVAAPDWATPSAMALKKSGAVNSAQHEPNFLSNLDCSLMDYRLTDGQTIQSGCFTPTAFGLMDIDNGRVVFNGTDEGLPLLPYSPQQGLVPWPQSGGVVTTVPVSTGGAYIGLYKNPLAHIQDQRNSVLELTAKQLTVGQDLLFKDSSGKLLVVNPQTIAFSDNGSWLVVETLEGAFIRINLATLEMVAFSSSFYTTGSPGLHDSQVAVSENGRYVAINNDTAAVLQVYDLAGCDGSAVDLQPQKCGVHDYMPFVRQRIAGFHAIRHLRFVDDGLLSFDVRTDNSDGGGVYELAPRDKITSLIDYLGLGDSYTSGEGAFDYLSGTDTADDMCHLSVNSYPLLLTRALFGSSGGHSVACSGAVINDVGNTGDNYRGQVKGVAAFDQLQKSQAALLNSIMTNYAPGYVAQQRFVRQYQPATMTVSVGGDDIGFGNIVKNCVMPHITLHLSDNTCYDSYEDRLELTKLVDRTVPRWTALYRQLLAEAPGTRLYAIGYPQIATDSGNCGLNVHLNKGELEFAEELIDYLNSGVRKAATQAGVDYVDVSQALAGHRLCEAAGYDVAVNGLTAGKDGSVLGVRVFGKESYHPNALGQSLIEQAVLEKTHNLAMTSGTSINAGDQDILNAPKTGRTVNAVVPDDGLTGGVIRVGESTVLQAGGQRDGLKANTVYKVRLDGAAGPVIGTVASNDQGDIYTTISPPGGISPGGHTVDITGEGQAGEPVDVTQPVYVPASGNDTDGDGITDNTDSCPGAINSGQDIDRDGIDDVCDGSINPPLTVGQGSSDRPDSTGGAGGFNGSAKESGPDILENQSPTIVTSFISDDRQESRVLISPVAGQSLNNGLGNIHIAVNVATNRTTVAAAVLKSITPLPIIKQEIKPASPLTQPRIVNRLPWVILLLILWLLILLCLYLCWSVSRRTRDVDT